MWPCAPSGRSSLFGSPASLRSPSPAGHPYASVPAPEELPNRRFFWSRAKASRGHPSRHRSSPPIEIHRPPSSPRGGLRSLPSRPQRRRRSGAVTDLAPGGAGGPRRTSPNGHPAARKRSSASSSACATATSPKRRATARSGSAWARRNSAAPSYASLSATPGSAAAGQTAQPPPPLSATAGAWGAVPGKVTKKKAGARLWMRLDRWGTSEVVELDKASIIRRAGLRSRDLRIVGPVFSRSSSILAREKAMVINLEFIRVIVTAEEIILNSLVATVYSICNNGDMI